MKNAVLADTTASAQPHAVIGRGRTADILAWEGGRALKLFHDGVSAGAAQAEARTAQLIQAAGLPAPACHGMIEVEGRLGILFDRVSGPTLLRDMTSRPWRLLAAAHLLATLHAGMHQRSAPGLPSQPERLERRIRAAPALSPAARQAVLDALARLPSGAAICHGDFHPDNVVITSRGPVVLDWADATSGHPLGDVARTSLLLQLGGIPPGTPGRRVFEVGRTLFHRAYVRRYFQLRSGAREQLDAWRAPVAAARLAEAIAEEQDRLLAIVEAA